MRVLLTGKNGQLGSCLQDLITNTSHDLFAFDSSELDITNQEEVVKITNVVKPNVIINAAAYTAVDQAELECDQAYAVNEFGVKYLAEQASVLDIPLFHVSTDYVFDGLNVEPYQPSSKTEPQGVYGQSKLAGEKVIASTLDKYIILRTAWVFSEYGNNFVKTMLRLANEKDELSVVSDQYGNPTYAKDLARSIVQLCDQYNSKGVLEWGVYHYTGDISTSWHGFARAILFKANKLNLIDKMPKLTPISSESFPTAVKRPAYSILDNSDLKRLNISNSSWLSALDIVLSKLP
ncbi:dTDP-4-dehydrorhamnose reductase [Marinomonas sp. C2222]|uniref:dTDP-4-dehydrorhamnose reductase n=1 Tax=Marinomonas sargassi TaxID=2984494 RepID=A0ABT2YP18_9GAMM|nr:dTDP-4-dehydrorhamnose reductase [Marinomonas sargassi]MCV2401625.1 dTDP-4-dehydrorhamnose reductase [Marinomonas sargassi]